jgi:hypothetical protein
MMNTGLIILIVIVGVVVVATIGAVMLELYIRLRTKAKLRQLFGPEHERVLNRHGDQRKNWRWNLSFRKQIPSMEVVRSTWSRVKKNVKDAIIRDLEPLKDAKGGGGFKGKSKSTKGDGGTKGSR